MDEILNCQRSPFDKFGLGYNKEEGKFEVGTWSPNTPEASPSMSKNESKAPCQEPAQHKEDIKDQKDVKKLVPLLKEYSKEIQLQDGIKHPGMNMVLMVIVIHVMILVIVIWIVDYVSTFHTPGV